MCALSLEAVAAKAKLDKSHAPLPQPPGGDHTYKFGEIWGHNIVVAYLPAGVYGIAAAATAVGHMRISIRFTVSVGVGGGVPVRSMIPD